ncbi:MAG: hypothetical protein ABSC94_18375 [Polyangiaceae bacterium]|jgi:hypothetical protein
MREPYESGVMLTESAIRLSREDALQMCDELLHQTAIVSMNLEFLFRCGDGERRAAAEDAQTSLARIVEIIRAVHSAENESSLTASPRVRRSA